jgi:hypothetical protein
MFGFESRQEKQFKQRVAVRTALRQLDRIEKESAESVERHRTFARQAREYGDPASYQQARESLRTALDTKKLLLSVRISIESSRLTLTQGEIASSFQNALTSVSKAFEVMNKGLNLPRMAARSQVANAKIFNVREQLDGAMAELRDATSVQSPGATSDEELDSLIDGADKATALRQLDEMSKIRERIGSMRDSVRQQ